MVSKDELFARLSAVAQEHLLAFWDMLAPTERAVLADEIEGVDFALVDRLFREKTAGEDWAALAMRAEPPEAIRLADQRGPAAAKARALGKAVLAEGHVGAILVAGGQGTRLGFDHPKGMYPIGPVSGASLFQILLEKILAASRRYKKAIPLCLMTSPATHDETIAYLDEQQRFGLPREDVRVFCQGTMPAVDALTGKLLLAERGRLALSPDGHGGMLAALAASGALAELERRGIRQVYYFQVDNPLAYVCDPLFIGHHVLADSEMSTQVVAKREPLERVGNLVRVDGQTRIIEYSDLAEAAARRRLPDGSLALWAGNTAAHVIDVPFLARMASSDKLPSIAAAWREGRLRFAARMRCAEDSLPFHRAHKKVPYVDASGAMIEPAEPNALKFERFIFDLLPAARRAIAVEVDQAVAFGPVKNAPGSPTDCPETVKAQMVALHTAWLRRAGVDVAPGVPVEISPLVALKATDLKSKVPPGTRVTAPRYFA